MIKWKKQTEIFIVAVLMWPSEFWMCGFEACATLVASRISFSDMFFIFCTVYVPLHAFSAWLFVYSVSLCGPLLADDFRRLFMLFFIYVHLEHTWLLFIGCWFKQIQATLELYTKYTIVSAICMWTRCRTNVITETEFIYFVRCAFYLFFKPTNFIMNDRKKRRRNNGKKIICIVRWISEWERKQKLARKISTRQQNKHSAEFFGSITQTHSLHRTTSQKIVYAIPYYYWPFGVGWFFSCSKNGTTVCNVTMKQHTYKYKKKYNKKHICATCVIIKS